LEMTTHRLGTLVSQRMQQDEERVRSMEKLLTSLGPEGVLARGFSLTTDRSGKAVTDAANLAQGDLLITKLAKGSVSSVVTK
jgi:exodeoxyribonuclease VII large subunit